MIGKTNAVQLGLFYDVPMDACNRKIAHLMSMMYSSSDSTTSKRAAKKAWPRPESRQTSKKKSKSKCVSFESVNAKCVVLDQQRWDVEKILDVRVLKTGILEEREFKIRWLDFDESYDEWVPQHFLSLPYDQYNCDPIVLDKMNSLEGC